MSHEAWMYVSSLGRLRKPLGIAPLDGQGLGGCPTAVAIFISPTPYGLNCNRKRNMIIPNRVLLLTITVAFSACAQSSSAWCAETTTLTTVKVSTRDELRQAVESAVPGTQILIAQGTYRGGLSFARLHGEKGKPIVLSALDEKNPPVFNGGTTCLHLTNPKHIELRSLVLTNATGNGLNIDDGGSHDTPASHILLRNLLIRDIGPNGNRDGIKLSGVDSFAIEGCTIQRWGDAGSAIDMVGCHQGQISGCSLQHRGDILGSGIQTKGGSSEITIKRCRFENAGSRAVNIGGSTGRDYFRPKSPGYEAKDITVEDCTFIGSMAPIVFVGVDGAVVRYNTIYRPIRWLMRILQESQDADFAPCRNGVFSNNVIAYRSDELRTVINIGKGTLPQTFKFADNHWFCIDEPQRSSRVTLPVEEVGGMHGQDPKFVNANEDDLRLMETTPVRNAGVRVTRELLHHGP
jgi:hypothetical protein